MKSVTSNTGTGKKKAKRGAKLPWTKPGHNGIHPEVKKVVQ